MEGPWRPSWPDVTRREVHNREERPWRSEPQARRQQGSGGALGIGNNRSVWGKIMTQVFTQALDKAVGQATFEILDSGIRITAVEPRGFSRTHPTLLGLAQAQMPAESLRRPDWLASVPVEKPYQRRPRRRRIGFLPDLDAESDGHHVHGQGRQPHGVAGPAAHRHIQLGGAHLQAGARGAVVRGGVRGVLDGHRHRGVVARFERESLVHKVYSTSSTAMHAGTVENTDANRQLLADAQDICRRGILKRRREGATPIWNDLVLGKGT